MADEQECELDVAAFTRITAFSDLTHDVVTEKPMEGEGEQEERKLGKFTVLTNLVAGVEGEVTNLDGGFKTGPQDWTTRKCGKVDLSMWIF